MNSMEISDEQLRIIQAMRHSRKYGLDLPKTPALMGLLARGYVEATPERYVVTPLGKAVAYYARRGQWAFGLQRTAEARRLRVQELEETERNLVAERDQLELENRELRGQLVTTRRAVATMAEIVHDAYSGAE